MNTTEKLEQALRTLRETDSGIAAPTHLETRLRAAFRERHQPRPLWRRWAWGTVPALAAALGGIYWNISAPLRTAVPQPQLAAKAPVLPPISLTVPTAAPAIAAATRPALVAKRRPATQQPAEAVGEFLSLPYAPPFTQYDSGQVARVNLPRISVRSFGLPVNEERLSERIPAELLVGSDGVPRAIRIQDATRYR